MRDPVPVSVPGMYGCAPVHRLRRCSVTPQQRAAEPCDSLTQDLRERGWLRPRHEAFESTVGRVVSPIVLPIGRKRRWSRNRADTQPLMRWNVAATWKSAGEPFHLEEERGRVGIGPALPAEGE